MGAQYAELNIIYIAFGCVLGVNNWGKKKLPHSHAYQMNTRRRYKRLSLYFSKNIFILKFVKHKATHLKKKNTRTHY